MTVEFDPARLRCRDVELLARPGPDGAMRSVRLRRDMRTGDHLIVEVAGAPPPEDRCLPPEARGDVTMVLFRDHDLDAAVRWAQDRLGVELVALGR